MTLLRRILICLAARRWAQTWAAVYQMGYEAGIYDAEHRPATRMRVVNGDRD